MTVPGVAVANAVRGACSDLLARYPAFLNAARSIESPHPEDDEWVKLGITAFSTYAGGAEWGVEELQLLTELRASEFTDAVLAARGDDAGPYERFGCLCIGAVLGLRRLGALKNDDELLMAQGVAMAFMTFNELAICGLE